ncbi:hypothetical protein D3C81_2128490 [compost metagenome]
MIIQRKQIRSYGIGIDEQHITGLKNLLILPLQMPSRNLLQLIQRQPPLDLMGLPILSAILRHPNRVVLFCQVGG